MTIKNIFAAIGVLVVLNWVLGWGTALYQRARRESLVKQALPVNLLIKNLRQVAVPSNCPLTVLSAGQQVFYSPEGPTSVKINSIQVTNRSHADLVFYRLTWTFSPVDSSIQKTSMELPADIDSIVKAGQSHETETPNVAAISEYGFTSIAGRISSASFSDGTTCDSGDPPEFGAVIHTRP